MMENKNYRCMKCEGKNVREHGLYCPERDKKKKSEKEALK